MGCLACDLRSRDCDLGPRHLSCDICSWMHVECIPCPGPIPKQMKDSPEAEECRDEVERLMEPLGVGIALLPINRSFLLGLEALLKGIIGAGASDPRAYPQLHFVPSGDQSYAGSFQQTVIGGTSDDASRFPVAEPMISGSQYELNRGVRTLPDFSFGPVPNIPNACDGSTAGSFSHDTEQAYVGADASQAIGHGSFPFPDPNPPPSHPLTVQPTWNNVALNTSTHADMTSSTYPVPISSTGHSHLNPLENNIESPPVSPQTEGRLIATLENFVYFLRWSAVALGFRLVPF